MTCPSPEAGAPRAQGHARLAAAIAIVASVVLIPLLYWPSLTYAYQTPKMLTLRLSVAVMLVAGFVVLVGRGRPRIRLRLPDVAMVTFLAWMGLAALLSPWPRASIFGIPMRFEGYLGFVAYAVFYFTASLGRQPLHRALTQAVAASTAVVGLLAALETHGCYAPVGIGAFG